MFDKLNKFYSVKKTILPYFIAIIVLLLCNIIFSLLPRQKWIVFGIALFEIIFISAIFILYKFKKFKALRTMISVTLFVEAITTLAYSFMSYPKSPNNTYVYFIFYIICGLACFAMFITVLVLHAHLNKERDKTTLFALYIINFLYCFNCLVLMILTIVAMGQESFSLSLLTDLFSYGAEIIMSLLILSIETQTLAEASAQLDKKSNVNKK